MKTVRLICDGGCSGNGQDGNVGGWGAVLDYKGNLKELYGGAPETTNNIMELTAVIEGLKALTQKDVQIDIFSDSAYVVNCFRQGWYHKWRLNGWKNAKKEPVENQALWIELIELVESFNRVTFYKIKGHLNHQSKTDINKWYGKFNKDNQLSYSLDAFLEISTLNHQADALANKGMDANRH